MNEEKTPEELEEPGIRWATPEETARYIAEQKGQVLISIFHGGKPQTRPTSDRNNDFDSDTPPVEDDSPPWEEGLLPLPKDFKLEMQPQAEQKRSTNENNL